MRCVCACDALSQQYLEEEVGYGQLDCSIMPGTRKLHCPASHRALALLLDDALQSVAGNSRKIAKKNSQLLGALIMWFAGQDQNMQVHHLERPRLYFLHGWCFLNLSLKSDYQRVSYSRGEDWDQEQV
jgi:hypothetical protein